MIKPNSLSMTSKATSSIPRRIKPSQPLASQKHSTHHGATHPNVMTLQDSSILVDVIMTQTSAALSQQTPKATQTPITSMPTSLTTLSQITTPMACSSPHKQSAFSMTKE